MPLLLAVGLLTLPPGSLPHPCSLLLSCSVPSLSSYQVPGDGSSLRTLSGANVPQKQGVVPRASAQLRRVWETRESWVGERSLAWGFLESTSALGRDRLHLTWTHSQSSDHHGVARELLPWLGGAVQVPHHDRPVTRGAEELA